LQFDGERLVVEVQSPFHESTMSEERHRNTLAEALHASLGVKPALAFIARGSHAAADGEGSATDAHPSARAEVADVAEIADYETAVPVEGSAHDPIELVKKGLGAEIVEERT
jgi:hypothetical protein